MKIIGNLDEELARDCLKLIEDRESLEDKYSSFNDYLLNSDDSIFRSGSQNNILFTGTYALRYPKDPDWRKWPEYAKIYSKNVRIGQKLKDIGFQMCEIYGASIGDLEIPFLVIEQLHNMVYPNELTSRERKIVKKQHDEQIVLVKSHGIVPYDNYCESRNVGVGSHDCNWVYNRPTKKIKFLADIDDWEELKWI